MRKTFLKVSILAALGVAMSASFTSCKDYDDDIKDLQDQVDTLKQSISTLEGKINAGAVITSVSPIDNGYRFTLSDGNSYEITNGKNGENGKDGKDGESNLWEIVKNAKGELVWALNGVATEYPAQGPAGENGESLPGIYYKPGENGYWIEVNPADGTEKETTIAWKPAATESLYAVVDNDKVVIYNFTDENGKTIDPVTIWKSSFIKSLVVKPELYLNGIEAVEYGVAQKVAIKETVAAPAGGKEVTGANGTSDKATVLAGQPSEYSSSEEDVWYATELGNIQYAVNPTTAAISNVDWALAFDDIRVVKRSSEVAGTVTGASEVDENGYVTLTYQLDKDVAYDQIAPCAEEDVNNDKDSKWTFMAVQATNKTDNNSVVTSDNVAILKQWVDFQAIVVDQTLPVEPKVEAAVSASKAIIAAYDETSTSPVLKMAYNEIFALPTHVGIKVAEQTPMLNGNNQAADATWGDAYVMSLKDAADKWGLTPKFQLVDYTIQPNQTSESKFAKLDANGNVIPQWVSADGAQNSAVGNDGKGRSAIGRRPLVYITLNDVDDNIVLAGFVKLDIDEPIAPAQDVVLGKKNIPYICNYEISSNWEQITGAVYEQFGLTADEFSKNYKLEGNAPEAGKSAATSDNVYVYVNGEYVNTTGNDEYTSGNSLGTWSWDINNDGSHTQALKFTVNQKNLEQWYPAYDKDGKVDGTEAPSTESKTMTVYARLVNGNGHEIYIGFDVTVLGAPAADYKGQIPSSWAQNGTVTPVNPAVPGQTGADVYGKNSYAQVMGMNFTSAWQGGDPMLQNYNAAYNFTAPNKDWYLYKVTANYQFAEEQADLTGLTGKYAIVRNGEVNGENDVHALYAYQYAADGTVNTEENGQPIVVINVNNAADDELGGAANYLGSTSTEATGVWNRIDFLSVYDFGPAGQVLSPARGAAVNGWKYGKYACDIINAKAYDFNNTPVNVNIEMIVTYGQNGEDCVLTVPGVYSFKAGAGRPVSLDKANDMTLQDGNIKKQQEPVSKLFTMKDWQGKALWTVATDGKVAASTVEGVNIGNFWMSLDKYADVQWPADVTSSSIVVDLAAATVSDSKGNKLGKFVDVYTDKHIDFVTTATTVDVTGNIARLTDFMDLDDVNIKWTNNGNSVTENIIISVPVYINYIWGQEILLGNATVTITPTLQAE